MKKTRKRLKILQSKGGIENVRNKVWTYEGCM